MEVGFTGTQKGMTEAQIKRLREVLQAFPTCCTVHHGQCIGADAEAHLIALAHGHHVEMWPASDVPASKVRKRLPSTVPYPESGVVLKRHVKRRAMDRNTIIARKDVLLAAPNGPEQQRSGTWATIRRARKNGTRIIIIRPDGTLEREGF